MTRRFDAPRVALVALALVTVVALLVAGATSTAAFGTYNPDWDGSAALRAQAEATGTTPTVVRNVSEVDATRANRTLVVVLAPETAYAEADVSRLAAFVRRGGTVLVADDFGPHANALLAGLGAHARIDGRVVRDERRYYRSPALPVAPNVTDDALTANVSRLTLNHGSVVRPAGASVLVATSEFSYLDADRNGSLDDAEELASYPVVTSERVGAGRVVVVSDPSIFINAMLDRSGNRAFARTLLAGFDTVVFDHSHVARLPPVAFALLVLRGSPLAQLLVGAIAIGLVGTWARRPGWLAKAGDRLRGGSLDDAEAPSPRELQAAIERAHPDWDDERIERVIRGIITQQAKEDGDDRPR